MSVPRRKLHELPSEPTPDFILLCPKYLCTRKDTKDIDDEFLLNLDTRDASAFENVFVAYIIL